MRRGRCFVTDKKAIRKTRNELKADTNQPVRVPSEASLASLSARGALSREALLGTSFSGTRSARAGEGGGGGEGLLLARYHGGVDGAEGCNYAAPPPDTPPPDTTHIHTHNGNAHADAHAGAHPQAWLKEFAERLPEKEDEEEEVVVEPRKVRLEKLRTSTDPYEK